MKTILKKEIRVEGDDGEFVADIIIEINTYEHLYSIGFMPKNFKGPNHRKSYFSRRELFLDLHGMERTFEYMLSEKAYPNLKTAYITAFIEKGYVIDPESSRLWQTLLI